MSDVLEQLHVAYENRTPRGERLATWIERGLPPPRGRAWVRLRSVSHALSSRFEGNTPRLDAAAHIRRHAVPLARERERLRREDAEMAAWLLRGEVAELRSDVKHAEEKAKEFAAQAQRLINDLQGEGERLQRAEHVAQLACDELNMLHEERERLMLEIEDLRAFKADAEEEAGMLRAVHRVGCPACDAMVKNVVSETSRLRSENEARRIEAALRPIGGETSDGYHTFNELYAHRHTLWKSVCRLVGGSWRSRTHSDGYSMPGWFVLGLGKDPGQQCTYHLPESEWDACAFAETLEMAPKFDGHTSADVMTRISSLVATTRDGVAVSPWISVARLWRDAAQEAETAVLRLVAQAPTREEVEHAVDVFRHAVLDNDNWYSPPEGKPLPASSADEARVRVKSAKDALVALATRKGV